MLTYADISYVSIRQHTAAYSSLRQHTSRSGASGLYGKESDQEVREMEGGEVRVSIGTMSEVC